jgi:hypothetical protein
VRAGRRRVGTHHVADPVADELVALETLPALMLSFQRRTRSRSRGAGEKTPRDVPGKPLRAIVLRYESDR